MDTGCWVGEEWEGVEGVSLRSWDFGVVVGQQGVEAEAERRNRQIDLRFQELAEAVHLELGILENDLEVHCIDLVDKVHHKES